MGFGGCGASPPTISNLAVEPGTEPSSATLTLNTSEPTRVTVGIDDGHRFRTVTSGTNHEGYHALSVTGLRPATTHTITLSAVTEDGRKTVADPRAFTTPPLGP